MRRVLSAVLLLPVVFFVTRYLPPGAFFVMVAVVLAVAVFEFCHLASRRGFAPQVWSALAGALLIAYSFLDPRFEALEAFALLCVVLPVLALLRRDGAADKFGNLVMTIFPVIFLGLLLGYIVALRGLPGEDGHDLPFLLLLIVWTADTGAYYGGRGFGRRPLAPEISPRKTQEGAACGIVSGLAAAFLARAWFIHRLGVVDCLVLGLLLPTVGVAGDLLESSLKRWAGAKDSGRMIPGHGGILDRIDALLLAAPVLFYYHRGFMGRLVG